MSSGMVSVTRDGKTLVKAIAGCRGENADKLSGLIGERSLYKPEDIETAAREVHFGCFECRTIQGGPEAASIIDNNSEGGLSGIYLDRAKFLDPRLNPQSESGTADHVILIEHGAEQLEGA